MAPSHLSASEILGVEDLGFVDQLVPEWKDAEGQPTLVRIVQLSAEGVLDLTDEIEQPESKGLGMFLTIVRCARNPDGTPLFTVDDIPKLKKKNMRVLNRLQRIALRLNNVSDASEITDPKKDSGGIVTGASPTVSPKS